MIGWLYGSTRAAGAALLSMALLLGCGGGISSDGGVVGSGISAVSGNVVGVQLDSSADAAAASASPLSLPPIRVSTEEDPDAVTDVDPTDGSFRLDVHATGQVHLVFAVDSAQPITAILELDLPDNSEVVLQDVEVLGGEVFVRQKPLNFVGYVQSLDCASGRIEVVDRNPNGSSLPNLFVLYLPEDGVRFDDVPPIECSQIRIGDRLGVHAAFLRGRETEDDVPTIDGVEVELDPPAGPPESIPMQRKGTLVQADCAGGELKLQEMRRQFADVFNARISPTTQFVCGDEACAHGCADLKPGDNLEIRGRSALGRPDTVQADLVTVRSKPSEFQAHVVGLVTAIDCVSGVMHVDDRQFDVDDPPIALTGETEFECNRPKKASCGCADVRPGDHVEADVTVRPGVVPEVTADDVHVVRLGGNPKANRVSK